MTADMTFKCSASPWDVRRMLFDLRAHLEAEDLPDATCGTMETVLAEALNNIVDHACRPGECGVITLTLTTGEGRLTCHLRDPGGAMAGLAPPDGTLPDLRRPRAMLPERGFGWSLIHALTARAQYRRDGAENHLTLDFDLDMS